MRREGAGVLLVLAILCGLTLRELVLIPHLPQAAIYHSHLPENSSGPWEEEAGNVEGENEVEVESSTMRPTSSPETSTVAGNISSPFRFSSNVTGFSDILDLRLGTVLNDRARLALAYARLALAVERGETDTEVNLKEEVVSLMGGTLPQSRKPADEKPLQILLLATWSSGSTFLTKLITHYPGTFLTFEPMVYIKGYGAVESSRALDAVSLLRSVFSCNFTTGSPANAMLSFLSKSGYKKWPLHNIRLRNVCEGVADKDDLCLSPDFLAKACQLYPTHLVKTVRMRVVQAEPLLQKPQDLNLKILVLFRDPRAVRSSRLRRKSWCWFPACGSLKRQCEDHDQDLEDAERLAQLYPGQVSIVKYEEVARKPKTTLPIILKFLGLPWHPSLTKFMADHMVEDAKHNKEGDLHTQSVNSRQKTESWRKKLSSSQRKEVEETCKLTIANHEALTMLRTPANQPKN